MNDTGGNDQGRPNRHVVVVGALALVAGSIALVPMLSGEVAIDKTNAFWFIGLLVIITAALTATAMVFAGLNLANTSEAFALPAGSIRTLLAIGIMVLFAVFGLTSLGSGSMRLGDKPVAEIDVEGDATRVAEEVKRYQDAQFIVVAKSAKASAGAVPATPARLLLYVREPKKDTAVTELEKQILTALITLLTSVIGFYFGSRSASEGLRTSSPGSGNPDRDPNPNPNPSPHPNPSPSAMLSRIQQMQKRLDALLQRTEPALPDKREAFVRARSSAVSVNEQVEALRKRTEDAATSSADRIRLFVELNARTTELQKLLTEAEAQLS